MHIYRFLLCRGVQERTDNDRSDRHMRCERYASAQVLFWMRDRERPPTRDMWCGEDVAQEVSRRQRNRELDQEQHQRMR